MLVSCCVADEPEAFIALARATPALLMSRVYIDGHHPSLILRKSWPPLADGDKVVYYPAAEGLAQTWGEAVRGAIHGSGGGSGVRALYTVQATDTGTQTELARSHIVPDDPNKQVDETINERIVGHVRIWGEGQGPRVFPADDNLYGLLVHVKPPRLLEALGVVIDNDGNADAPNIKAGCACNFCSRNRAAGGGASGTAAGAHQ